MTSSDALKRRAALAALVVSLIATIMKFGDRSQMGAVLLATSLVADLQGLDVEVEQIRLRDVPIRFCLNCRECTQQPGPEPGRCVLDDAMAELIGQIEACDCAEPCVRYTA